MGLSIKYVGETGEDLYASIQQVTASGALGDYWDNVAGAFAASVAEANREVTLTEGTGINLGSYSGGTGKLGTYTGNIYVRIHDRNLTGQVIGQGEVRLFDGNEIAAAGTDDLAALPLAVYDEIQAQGGVTSANMRGTDGALLATSYVAPNNAGITSAVTYSQSASEDAAEALVEATAAKLAAQSADNKLPADTSTKLGRLDVVLSTRSSHTPADVRAELNLNPVPASNMRGTDGALLATSYVAPNNSAILLAQTAAEQAEIASELVEQRLTAVRAGYLDNLSAGPVATQAQVSAITNTTRSKFVAPAEVQIPSSGSSQVLITLVLFDGDGNLNSADAMPTVTAKNAAGVDRSANLGAVSNPSTGKYEVYYTVSSAHLEELINLQANWVEGGIPSLDIVTMSISALITGGGFTTTDRTNLNSIFNKLPSRLYLTGTDAADGDINLDNLTGDRDSFKADVSALATSAGLAALEAHGDLAWITATGFVLATDGRLDNLDVPVSTRSTFNPGSAVALQSDIAALQAHGDLFWDTAVGFLTSTDPRLNNLDATISSRSTFNNLVDQVALAPGHGLSLEATSQSIKAKTDLIPAQPAETADIPTPAEIAVQVDATITASHGTGSYAEGLGDATMAKQDQILAQIAAMTPTPVSPVEVSPSRTWLLRSTGEGAIATNLVTISVAETVTLSADFSRMINPEASITIVTEVTVLEGAALTTSNLKPSGRRTAAHFTVTGATVGLRKLAVKVSTSDGEVIIGKVTLEVI